MIIYPINYLRPFLGADKKCEERLKTALAAMSGGHAFILFLGRARAGIYLLIKLAVKSGRRRVVMSPYTIPDVVNMVKFAGGEPVFVDCLPGSTNINVDQLSQLIDSTTACVLITHYHVNQNRATEIRDLCKSHGIYLFDDAAIAFGCDFLGDRGGELNDGSVLSFSGFKALNYFWGGALMTGNMEFARKLSDIVEAWPRLTAAQYAYQWLKILKYDLATRQFAFPAFVFPRYRKKIIEREIEDVLPVSRIESHSLEDTITSRPAYAAIREWDRKLPSVGNYLRHRQSISAIYDEYFDADRVSAETSALVSSKSSHLNYPIIVGKECRNEVYRKILSQGFDVGLSLYPNVHEVEGFQSIPGSSDNVRTLVRSVITLPTHPRINADYARALASTVKTIRSELH